MTTYHVSTELKCEFEPARQRLEKSLAAFSDSQMTLPVLDGGWTIKDVLAHVAFWDDRLVYAVHPPPDARNPLMPVAVEDIAQTAGWVDRVNARVYELNRDRRLAEVRADFDRAYAEVHRVVSALDDHELLDESGLTRRWGFPAMEMFSGIREHYDEHAEALEKLYQTKFSASSSAGA